MIATFKTVCVASTWEVDKYRAGSAAAIKEWVATAWAAQSGAEKIGPFA
jgi:hypothetical protein